jgi:hypothetical protein
MPVLVLEQLGNPKIEQFHLAVAANQNVRRLKVAVHNQVRVRIGDRLQDVEKQPDTGLDTQSLLIAVAVDVVALDMLENEIGLSGVRYPRIDQFGDIRVRQSAENDAFALESLFAARSARF